MMDCSAENGKSPQPDQDKNGERAEQPKQRENPEKASRIDEAQRWVHGESLCDDANRAAACKASFLMLEAQEAASRP
jgi:hypothetical protein